MKSTAAYSTLLALTALFFVFSAPVEASSLRLERCLTPGRCHGKEWRRVLFPLAFRPVVGCFPGRGIVRRSSSRSMVALTFDDGPSVFTPEVLKVLRRYRVKATFFVVGSMITGNEQTLRQALRQGSTLGNHSFSHPQLTSLVETARADELKDTNYAISRAAGFRPCLMRPPYGLIDASVETDTRRAHLRPVLWDVDAADWQSPPPEVISERVLSAVRPGSIILLHDGGGDRSSTVAALPAIIEGLRSRGLRPVTVNRLLGIPSRR